MDSPRRRALGAAVTVQVSRFLVLYATVLLAPLVGISGWFVGLAANVTCTVFAVVLVTRYRLWHRIGWSWRPRGRRSLPWLAPFLVEALLWTLPAGLVDRPPGYGWWSLSLLLVGVNEELTSRGVVLSRLERAFPPGVAVAVTAALFGLQHLSAFATTSRGGVDILGNVLASACFGVALGAYQSRFRWIVPLIAAHAVLDLTPTLGAWSFGDLAVAAISVAYLAVGVAILRGRAPS
ncbi:CPBP family intramembrane glutamic endopeptidase [Nakamurella deserti]|uniref:CPBP family intramembrane glutamic endopeptidase n=1 Tax=Nakamurella deserti TaxID=2164074 RepID=UPI000DBE2297|nr:CPBP family intramembrane glutamic endopeptidase [Nakamurella deserti]